MELHRAGIVWFVTHSSCHIHSTTTILVLTWVLATTQLSTTDHVLLPVLPPKKFIAALKAEFLNFYARAWQYGYRVNDTIREWGCEFHQAKSNGRRKIIIYNSCYGGRSYSYALKSKICDVEKELESGMIQFDENDDHVVLVEAVMRLGREVDEGQKSINSGEQIESTIPKEKIPVLGQLDMASERKERYRILRLGLNAGSGRLAHLRFDEIPLMSPWSMEEYDGIETIVYA
ncbi:hypothetical protein BDP27DRAFT_1403395 [Rhodocollybia butyracea]|uniref:Uncharacterized protein n=1 Tax=Rhodocollybia butyracea TaxID=206335 RepID=A0A9P5PQF4_9AGAR|nr:hypothetical protein BDP27DRAFT_1403395 [Rhodocollybia butyracea]